MKYWRRNPVFAFPIFNTIDFYFELVHGACSQIKTRYIGTQGLYNLFYLSCLYITVHRTTTSAKFKTIRM